MVVVLCVPVTRFPVQIQDNIESPRVLLLPDGHTMQSPPPTSLKYPTSHSEGEGEREGEGEGEREGGREGEGEGEREGEGGGRGREREGEGGREREGEGERGREIITTDVQT